MSFATAVAPNIFEYSDLYTFFNIFLVGGISIRHNIWPHLTNLISGAAQIVDLPVEICLDIQQQTDEL